MNDEEKRQVIIETWGEAEKRIGKFVNLDEDTIKSFMTCPAHLLVDAIQSLLSRR